MEIMAYVSVRYDLYGSEPTTEQAIRYY